MKPNGSFEVVMYFQGLRHALNFLYDGIPYALREDGLFTASLWKGINFNEYGVHDFQCVQRVEDPELETLARSVRRLLPDATMREPL